MTYAGCGWLNASKPEAMLYYLCGAYFLARLYGCHRSIASIPINSQLISMEISSVIFAGGIRVDDLDFFGIIR